MPISRIEQMLDKMRYDIHDIDKQLKRIADALDRAYPKPRPDDSNVKTKTITEVIAGMTEQEKKSLHGKLPRYLRNEPYQTKPMNDEED